MPAVPRTLFVALLTASFSPGTLRAGEGPRKAGIAHDGKAHAVWAEERRKRWRKGLASKRHKDETAQPPERAVP